MDGWGGGVKKNATTLARRRDERYTEANRGWTRCSGALECRWTQRPTSGCEKERVVGDGEEATEAPPGNRRATPAGMGTSTTTTTRAGMRAKTKTVAGPATAAEAGGVPSNTGGDRGRGGCGQRNDDEADSSAERAETAEIMTTMTWGSGTRAERVVGGGEEATAAPPGNRREAHIADAETDTTTNATTATAKVKTKTTAGTRRRRRRRALLPQRRRPRQRRVAACVATAAPTTTQK